MGKETQKQELNNDYFLTVDEILSMPAPGWLVKGLIPQGGVGVLYGATGSYKSFLALHLAAKCSVGHEAFSGYPCKKVPVFYIAAEAASGFKLRVKAWIKRHGSQPEYFFLRPWPVYIDNETMLNTLVEEIRERNFIGEHCLVVIDTLSANFTGNENSNDMAKFVQGCLRISKEVDATVLIVHHTGKDESKGMRGHNSINANTDFAIYMEGKQLRAQITVKKLKDSPVGLTMNLRAVNIPLDLRAEITSSLILEEDTGFEDEGSHEIVWKCAITIGEDKITQKTLRETLMKQQNWDSTKANRAIQAALEDNKPVITGGFIIERTGSGKGQRHITVKNKTPENDNAMTSAGFDDVE